MRRMPVERLRARWVTGPYGHGAAFALDLGAMLRMWLHWQWLVRRGRAPVDGATPPSGR